MSNMNTGHCGYTTPPCPPDPVEIDCVECDAELTRATAVWVTDVCGDKVPVCAKCAMPDTGTIPATVIMRDGSRLYIKTDGTMPHDAVGYILNGRAE